MMLKRHFAKSPKYLWLILTLEVILWLAWLGVVGLLPPDSMAGMISFFLLLVLAVGILCWLILRQIRRSLLLTSALVGLAMLRFWDLDQWPNVAMLLGLLLMVELVFVVK